MDEPSLLDYLKERLNPRRLLKGEKTPLVLPAAPLAEAETPAPRRSNLAALPWRSLLALALALAGQRFFEPGVAQPRLGIGFYLVAAGLLIAALIKREWGMPTLKPVTDQRLITSVRKTPLFMFVLLLVITFFSFSGNCLLYTSPSPRDRG